MHPVLAANQADLDECCDGLIALLGRLENDALNWMPPVPDTNSIAGLVIHSMSALTRWLARGVGAPLPATDRAVELAGHSTSAELMALVGTSVEEAHSRLAELDGANLAENMSVTRAHGPGHAVTRAWCATHAIGHVREHWGHIQLTAQLYEAQTKPG